MLGGGVARLTVAHELVERGFDVVVLESRAIPGGKARSFRCRVQGWWERQSWWDFVGAERRSVAFQRFLADGLTRTLVAARAREISARTGGLILAQLLFDVTRAGGRADRVLDAPTNEAWIDPWVEHLRGLGVDLRLDCPVQGLVVAGDRIAGVTTPTGVVTADFYVAALPVEVMRTLAGPSLRRLEPRLANLDRLVTRWMNGMLFYLDTDIPIVHGHTIYIDSEWALTSISQAQFWRDVDVGGYGDGNVRGILSVDVSDWDTPGRRTGKVASRCSRDEIRAEVWGQLADHLNDGPQPVLDETRVLAWFLDPAIEFPNPTAATNLEPLLINTAGSWSDRPEATTRIANLMLAADYVRTNTDLATMEGANEAARRAVNAILDATNSPAPRCAVFELTEPAILRHARRLDQLRWRLFRRPARAPLRVADDGALTPAVCSDVSSSRSLHAAEAESRERPTQRPHHHQRRVVVHHFHTTSHRRERAHSHSLGRRPTRRTIGVTGIQKAATERHHHACQPHPIGMSAVAVARWCLPAFSTRRCWCGR